jgi:hypothetical protein
LGELQLTGIEIKAAATVTATDFKGLRKLRQAAGTRFMSGVVLYDGDSLVSFGKKLCAVPICLLWKM